MKFSDLISLYANQPEQVKLALEKLEKQFFYSCQKKGINAEEGKNVVLASSEDFPRFVFFEYKRERISKYMMILPTGDLILTENPENFIDVTSMNMN